MWSENSHSLQPLRPHLTRTYYSLHIVNTHRTRTVHTPRVVLRFCAKRTRTIRKSVMYVQRWQMSVNVDKRQDVREVWNQPDCPGNLQSADTRSGNGEHLVTEQTQLSTFSLLSLLGWNCEFFKIAPNVVFLVCRRREKSTSLRSFNGKMLILDMMCNNHFVKIEVSNAWKYRT